MAEKDPDPTKDKFRAALERKRTQQRGDGAGGPGQGDSKVHGTHDRAGGKRTFRRKSG